MESKDLDKDLNKDVTLENAFDMLDNIIEEMSGDDVPLEKSFDLYKDGVKLVKLCNEKIQKVEKKIEILDKNGAIDEL